MAYDERLAARLRDLTLGEPEVSEKAMFGGLAFLVRGHMAFCAGAQGSLLVRVPPARTEELLGEPHTDEFVMPQRTMRGWLRVEAAGLADDAALERWTALALDHVRSLPPK